MHKLDGERVRFFGPQSARAGDGLPEGVGTGGVEKEQPASEGGPYGRPRLQMVRTKNCELKTED